MSTRLFSLPLLSRAATKSVALVNYAYRSLIPDQALLRQLETQVKVALELTNVCNANCTFCGYQYQERPTRRMDDDLFARAVAGFVQMGGGVLDFCCLVGDPLLDPQLLQRIRYARSFTAITGVSTITNCIQLDKVGVEAFVDSGITAVTVSTTGFDPEMYKRVYRSSHFERMKKNLLALLRVNQQRGRPVQISIGLRIDRPVDEVLNIPEFQEVRALAHAVEANMFFDDWGGRIQSADLSGTMRVRPNWYPFIKPRLPCRQLWTGTMVLVDGTVTACGCRDLNGDSDLVIGNLRDTPLPELLRSTALRKIKTEWLNGQRVPNICRDCRHYSPYVTINNS
jgi:MoaA/NifB/PqqE/SkfB family radical SAM enzyme